jgi:hypothetical protein
LEGISRALIEVLSLYSLGGLRETPQNMSGQNGVLVEIRNEYLPNTSLESYRYANLQRGVAYNKENTVVMADEAG